MVENLASSTMSLSLSPQSYTSQSPVTKQQTPSKELFSPQTPPLSVTRLWRPKAQQNLRNQWSKLASYRKEWASSFSSGRSHATDLVNSYLSQRYMKAMELGVLINMPDIRKKACWKLYKRQELYRNKLVLSYKNMVTSVVNMHNSSRSMRIFLKGTSSSFTQFSNIREDKNDSGDGGGIPVFTFLSMSSLEELAYEFVRMYTLELSLKRLLVVELLSLSSEEFHIDPVSWSAELYPGEFDNLSLCELYSNDLHEPILPNMKKDSTKSVETTQHHLNEDVLQHLLLSESSSFESSSFKLSALLSNLPPYMVILFSKETLQKVYLTTWVAKVYIDTHRVDEILAVVGEEIHHTFS